MPLDPRIASSLVSYRMFGSCRYAAHNYRFLANVIAYAQEIYLVGEERCEAPSDCLESHEAARALALRRELRKPTIPLERPTYRVGLCAGSCVDLGLLQRVILGQTAAR
jgi:hypothetical protein